MEKVKHPNFEGNLKVLKYLISLSYLIDLNNKGNFNLNINTGTVRFTLKTKNTEITGSAHLKSNLESNETINEVILTILNELGK